MNQQNNPRDGLLPVSPLSEPIIAEPIVAEPIIVMLAQLVEVMIMLTHISTMQLTNNLSKAKTIQKPASFKRTEGGDTHRFLFTFNLWASVQCIALNVVNEQGHIVKKHQVEWIWAALSYSISRTMWQFGHLLQWKSSLEGPYLSSAAMICSMNSSKQGSKL